MKVFIENEAGLKLKNIFDEKKLKFQKTIKVSREYPYPYGFILNTTAEDGDNVDVFIITKKKLKQGEIIDVEVIGLMEQFEVSWDLNKKKEEIDHNVIAKLKNDKTFEFNELTRSELRNFVTHVFDYVMLNKTRIGKFLGRKEAIEYINMSSNEQNDCL